MATTRWCPACRWRTRSRPSTPTATSWAHRNGPDCARCRHRRASPPSCCGGPISERRDVHRRRAMVENIGGRVHVVDGDPLAFKITTPWTPAGQGGAGSLTWSCPGSGRASMCTPWNRSAVLVARLLFDGADGCAGHSDGDVAAMPCATPCCRRRIGVTSAACSASTIRGGAGDGPVMLAHVRELLAGRLPIGNAVVQVIGNRPNGRPAPGRGQQRALRAPRCAGLGLGDHHRRSGPDRAGEGGAIATALSSPMPVPPRTAGKGRTS